MNFKHPNLQVKPRYKLFLLNKLILLNNCKETMGQNFLSVISHTLADSRGKGAIQVPTQSSEVTRL